VYVTDSEGMAALIERISGASLLALDTEFMRERSYYARLCLIQLATDDVIALVDPLELEDLSPLYRILTDAATTKVFHAGSQDLDIFYRLMGEPMRPVFDTQVAATVAGFPQQVGYGALVKDCLGVSLEKAEGYTDWARRPLSAKQLAYAENDVRYLPELYRRLNGKLEEDGRLPWLRPDLERLEDPATYEVLPDEQWRRLKRVSQLDKRQLAVARELAAWRETEAQRKDVPKRWLLGDESVIEVARRQPLTAEDLGAVRGVKDKLPKSAYRQVIAAVERGLAVPEDQLPSFPKRKRIARDVDGAVDLMVALVRLRAREHGVAMPLLASRDDLERLAGGDRESSPLLEGWRKTMVGDELAELLDGRISLHLDDGVLRVVQELGSED